MRAKVVGDLAQTVAGARAEAVLRACVHCGMCNATCPTYELTGDELDGPRGRIYLIKQILEGEAPDRLTQIHLDRCLSCRACETTCPSGVEYHRLYDVGMEVAARTPRPARERLLRGLVRGVFSHEGLLGPLLGLARLGGPFLPGGLGRRLAAARRPAPARPAAGRRMSLLAGCVQAAAAPSINDAARRVFAHAGVALEDSPGVGCCGALAFHNGDPEGARRLARANVAVWDAALGAGEEAVVITASGCAAFVRDYGDLLADEPDWAARAARVAAAVRDPAGLLADAPLVAARAPERARVAVHDPCTLRNGARLAGVPAAILRRLGYQVSEGREAHMCCGSAGAYSLLHPELARPLRDRKLAALDADRVDAICTANIGCMLHLAGGSTTPVLHWLEAADDVL